MDYGFTEYQTAIRDLAREIAEKEIRPIAAEYDREAKFPWPVVKVLAETDLFRVYIDDEYGGISDGSPIMNMVIVTEELSKACGGIALSFAGHGAGHAAHHPLRQRGAEEALAARHRRREEARGLRAHRAASRFRRRRRAHHGHSRRRPLRDERHQAVDHQRRRGGNLLGHRPDQSRQGAARSLLHRGGEGHARLHLRQEGRQAGHSRLRHARADFPGLPRARGKLPGPRGHGLHHRHEDV